MVHLFGRRKKHNDASVNTPDTPSTPIRPNKAHDRKHRTHSGSHAKIDPEAPPSPSSHNLPYLNESHELTAAEQEEEDQITLATTFQSFKDMMAQQGWSLPELLFGIRWLHRGKQKRDFSLFMQNAIKIDEKVYEWLAYYERHCRICNCFDLKPRDEFLDLTGVDDAHCVEYNVHSTTERNGYVILVDHDAKEVTLYINGTQTLRDMMVDLHGKACAFMDGYAHQGMALWAKWFYKNKTDALEELLKQNPGYSLVLCGHSLGASTSVLAGFLMRERFPELKVIAFAVPKCISESLVEEAEKFVTSFVSMDDFVPLMSEQTWTELRQRVAQCNWKHYFYNDISSAAPFKAFLKIAPTRFHKFWDNLGKETFVKKSEEELQSEYRARTFSEKQKVEHYYNKHVRDRTNSVTSPQDASPGTPGGTSSGDDENSSQRSRSQSAPQRFVRPLGTLVSKSSYSSQTFTTETSSNQNGSSTNLSTFSSAELKTSHHMTPEHESHSTECTMQSGELQVTGKHIEDPFAEQSEMESRHSENGNRHKDAPQSDNGGKIPSSTSQSNAPQKSDDAIDKYDTTAIEATKEGASTSSADGGAPTLVETADGEKVVALYNPGVIYYIRCIEDQWYMSKENWKSSYFEKLEFNRTFLKDHLCASYLKGLKQLMHVYKSGKEMEEKKEAQQKFIALSQEANDLL